MRFECLEANGTRGGILMLWDNGIWRGTSFQIGSNTLT